MCQFCVEHGEGEKWYLEAKNYSEDLLADIKRRKFILSFMGHPSALKQQVEKIEQLDKLPGLVSNTIKRGITGYLKKNHYGQVLPIEDVERIISMTNSIVRMACICRHAIFGEEKRYCYGISMGPGGGELGKLLNELDPSFIEGPDRVGLESLTKKQAIAAMKKHEKEGLCHTVWTFQAPFIAGICNCDRSDCFAMQTTVTHGVSTMFRAEYVARPDGDKCTGCRSCMKLCQFGAIAYSAATKTIMIDPRRCYGCGICRAVCKTDAIYLEDRRQVPAAANMW